MALIYRNHLSIKQCDSPSYDSFEHMVIKIVSVSVIYHAVLLYRPPSASTTAFFHDFAKLMADVILLKGKLVILGDFNIHAK